MCDYQLTSLCPSEATGASNLRERKGREEVRVENLVTVPGSSQIWMVRERGRLGDKDGDSWEGGRPARSGGLVSPTTCRAAQPLNPGLGGHWGCTQQHPVLTGFSTGVFLAHPSAVGGRRRCVFVDVCELSRPRLTASDSGSEAPSGPALTFAAGRCPGGLPASVPS